MVINSINNSERILNSFLYFHINIEGYFPAGTASYFNPKVF